eukprot:TRINITY_DN7295_c0_g1_i4.p1 TRINITY_DN7295_c0_g1~~TRINITY_DN7295_c0_g1_i4.p1  ORF type:complete len:579 (-),score=91.42 TRINITY_DN7295_c0_g1_i4:131-1867(-)
MSLKFEVIRAKGLAAADSNASSDPYVLVLVGDKGLCKTKVKSKTLHPEWKQKFALPDNLPANDIVFQVWDSDKLGKDDFLGEVRLPLGGLSIGEEEWHRLSNGKGELQLKFSLMDSGSGMKKSSGSSKGDLPAKAFVTGSKMPNSSKSMVKKRVSACEKVNDGRGPLDLSGLSMTYVPATVQSLRCTLEELNLGFNKIKNYPQLTPFRQLQVLYLDGNVLQTIPPDIGVLINLRELYLNGNQLKNLPAQIGKLVALEKLVLANNKLATVPAEIGYLTRLEDLQLNGNPMKKGLPKTIGKCVGMEVLDLSFCQLTQLPNEFTRMTKILELNLATNNLHILPATMGRMTRLVKLDISDNKLQDLPMSLGYLIGLESLMIERNPIKSKRMMEKYKIGTDHLCDFLQKRMEEFLADHPQFTDPALLARPKRSKQPANSYASSPQASRSPVGQPLNLNQKLNLIKKESQALIGEIQTKLSDMKRSLAHSNTIESAVPIAQVVRQLKADVEKAKTLLPHMEKPRPPLIQPGEDKLTSIKKTVNVAIFDVERTINGIQNMIIGTQDPQKLVLLVKVVKTIRSRIC